MSTISPVLASESAWKLPAKYLELPPAEQAACVRTSILCFLEYVGRATLSEIVAAIGAPFAPTVRRQAQFLASTAQLYVDPVGRDPVYYRNGSLAHQLLQVNVPAGIREYAIRTYTDSLTGRYVTVTEFSVSPLGERSAKGGIHVDVADVEALARCLLRIAEQVKADPALLETGLVRENPQGRKR